MTGTALTLTLILLAASDSSAESSKPRPRSPYAPSLPLLSRAEEEKFDEIIDRFMQADIGRLPAAETRTAKRDFDKLGPEAIPALLRGLNRAARIQHSCPVVVIARKLQRMLLASDDAELLEYARDEIGAGVGATRHGSVLQDLRFQCMLRKNGLARQPARLRTSPAAERVPGPLQRLTVKQLAEAASTERGPRLKPILMELEKRQGGDVLSGLSMAAASSDQQIRQLGRNLLDQHLRRQTSDFLTEKLKDSDPEVRRAAVRVAARKGMTRAEELIALLDDPNAEVRFAAHQGLVSMSQGLDFGPPTRATSLQRQQAQQKWRIWLQNRGMR